MSRAAAILHELACCKIERPSILDFGCGTGWLIEILDQFGDAQGVDLAPETARGRYPHLRFHDAHSMPDGPFDIVVSQEVIEHIDNQKAYGETASRVLRTGGYLILTTPNAAVSLRRPELLVQLSKTISRVVSFALSLKRSSAFRSCIRSSTDSHVEGHIASRYAAVSS